MTIGQTLAAARTAAGMTVDQVCDATSIRRHIVTAIEHDDFAPSGGAFYARAHIRAIAHAVGADAAPLLAEYDARHAPAPAPMAAALEENLRAARARPTPNWSAAMAAAIVVVLAVGAFRLVTRGEGDALAAALSTAATASPSATASAAAPTAARRQAATRPAPRRVAADIVSVTLTATRGRSWISARDDGGDELWVGVLEKGESRAIRSKEKVRLTVANAGYVRLTVNGRDVGKAGKSGVARLVFSPGEPAAAPAR